MCKFSSLIILCLLACVGCADENIQIVTPTVVIDHGYPGSIPANVPVASPVVRNQPEPLALAPDVLTYSWADKSQPLTIVNDNKMDSLPVFVEAPKALPLPESEPAAPVIIPAVSQPPAPVNIPPQEQVEEFPAPVIIPAISAAP